MTNKDSRIERCIYTIMRFLYNIAVVISFTVLAALHGKWWVVLFAIFLYAYDQGMR